ncbi:uncharacterized protein LOC134536589 isoform X10 [Bacillus rossius redtenbacheri]|uniref:uncharacterized protein LOC134536589 isoform X10 n=1 Tax=Bacillus rossius redtenbacheri TaxID=93214 RepID=UPI002FDCB632
MRWSFRGPPRTLKTKAAREVDCSEQKPFEAVFLPIKEELTYELPADGDVCVKQEPITEELNELAAREVDCSEQKPFEVVFLPIKEELTNELPADGDVCVKQEPITEELNELCSCTGLCQQVKEEITIEEHPAAPGSM